MIVTSGSKSIQRWDGKTGDPIGAPMNLLQQNIVFGNDEFAFTDDGRYIVSTDEGLRFWDATTGASSADDSTNRPSTPCCWAPGDRMLYTESLDGGSSGQARRRGTTRCAPSSPPT